MMHIPELRFNAAGDLEISAAPTSAKTDFDFYAISIDFSDRVEQFNTRVKESKWPFPAYFDINREFRSVMPGELNGLPQLFVLDKKGAVVYHTRRYMPGDEDKLFEALEKM